MNSPHFSIFDNSEDHLPEQYFLSSSHFKGKNDSEEVFSAVHGLIQLINGASAIQWGFNDYISRGDVSLDCLYYSDKESPRDSDWSRIHRTAKSHPSNPFIGSPQKSISPYSSETTGYIELCLEHEDVFNLLHQISIGFDWRNLYCIWDTVCHYSGGGPKRAIKDLELDEKKIKSFTGTVNNFGVLGLEARHGVMGWQIPKDIIEHEDAIEIINHVVLKYLKKKVCLGCMKKSWAQAI